MRGLAARDRRRALRVGLLPALRADVRRRRLRRARRALRGGDRARSSRARRRRSTPSSTSARSSELTRRFQALYDFPQDPREQLDRAIDAVFDSWSGDRAVAYRRINGIPDDWGTAVNVQQMVFGNRGADVVLGRRVLARRGHRRARAERRLPARRAGRGRRVRRAHAARPRRAAPTGCRRSTPSCWRSCARLERHYGDMQDTEFTVEEGRLYMLQTRNAKRPPRRPCASPSTPSRRACSPASEAIATIDAGALDALLHPTFDPRRASSTSSRAASPPRPAPPRARSSSPRRTRSPPRPTAGASHPGAAVHRGRRRRRLPRRRGHPHLRGRQGVARRARGPRHGPPCGDRRRRASRSTCTRGDGARSAGHVLREGDLIAIDGTTGAVTLDDVPLVDAARSTTQLRDRARLVRRAAHARRARQRRHARGRAARARVRRRGHRPVPHRAHVHGRGPPAEDAAR